MQRSSQSNLFTDLTQTEATTVQGGHYYYSNPCYYRRVYYYRPSSSYTSSSPSVNQVTNVNVLIDD